MKLLTAYTIVFLLFTIIHIHFTNVQLEKLTNKQTTYQQASNQRAYQLQQDTLIIKIKIESNGK